MATRDISPSSPSDEFHPLDTTLAHIAKWDYGTLGIPYAVWIWLMSHKGTTKWNHNYHISINPIFYTTVCQQLLEKSTKAELQQQQQKSNITKL